MELLEPQKETARPITVSELVNILKTQTEKNHRSVLVIGEISSFKVWRSGHCYFDIKDDKALLPAIMFRPQAQSLIFEPKDGLKAIFSGRISIYAQTARLQILVNSIEPLGQGALALAFEKLKEKLKKEGLFEQKHKKSLPMLPQKIGIITSPQGAAVRDMLRIIYQRFPKASVLFAPAKVQGQGSKKEITNAIKLLDSKNICDVIILGRGGGSLEDLWAFNEEIVARAIFAAQTPIISAVGHETDISISDLVADVRAATPTHAAQIVVPDYAELLDSVEKLAKRLSLSLKSSLRKETIKFYDIKKRLSDPRIILYKHWQRLDRDSNFLNLAINKKFTLANKIFQTNNNKLLNINLKQKLLTKNQSLINSKKLLFDYANKIYLKNKNLLMEQAIKLESISPLKVLNRGYALLQKQKKIVKSIDHLKINDRVNIKLIDGEIEADITNIGK